MCIAIALVLCFIFGGLLSWFFFGGSESEETDVVGFRWTPPADPDIDE